MLFKKDSELLESFMTECITTGYCDNKHFDLYKYFIDIYGYKTTVDIFHRAFDVIKECRENYRISNAMRVFRTFGYKEV